LLPTGAAVKVSHEKTLGGDSSVPVDAGLEKVARRFELRLTTFI
jgi:hypothetical protein